MKRFIITSACTLVLSLFGAFGANQNLLNSDGANNSNSDTTKVVENVTNTENNQSLPSDTQTTAADIAAKDTDSKINEETPDYNEDAKDIYLEDNANTASESVTSTPVKETAAINTVKDTTVTVPAAKETAAIPVSQTNVKNGQVYVYKNINLSNCKSANDVVSKLQKNGYSNINANNIQNITSLKDILAAIQGNAATNNTAPTKTPAPTAVPAKPTTAPTTKPAPTTAPAPTTKPSTSTNTSGISSYAAEVLRLVNIERAKAGLSAFTTNQALSAAANKRAQETAQSFSHTRPNGSSFSTALQEFGVPYRTAGENIAYGQRSPQEVVTGWMNSPGHRANILNANFNKIGIGVYQTNGVIYWSQEFTN
jgi:uncharacterized protein YkwD